MENSGKPSARMVSQNSAAGKNARSATIPSTAFTTFTRMRSAWLAWPNSYVSGYIMQKRKSASGLYTQPNSWFK